jgi:hypothetical protein
MMDLGQIFICKAVTVAGDVNTQTSGIKMLQGAYACSMCCGRGTSGLLLGVVTHHSRSGPDLTAAHCTACSSKDAGRECEVMVN